MSLSKVTFTDYLKIGSIVFLAGGFFYRSKGTEDSLKAHLEQSEKKIEEFDSFKTRTAILENNQKLIFDFLQKIDNKLDKIDDKLNKKKDK